MSERFPGGIITKNPATPTGPFDTGAAPGIWTLDQQMQYQQQGIWPTAGLSPNYIEDVFSTYLYTGNGSTQTITNNIDLSTKGGLVWIKARNQAAYPHRLLDTDRNALGSRLSSNDTEAQVVNTPSTSLATPLSTGFALGANSRGQEINNTNTNFVSWTFRKQPKFFDVVTWTGDGTGDREIPHNLGSAPGCIILKSTSTGGTNWFVYHRALSTPNYRYIYLQDTAAALTSGSNLWNVTSTTFRASSTLDANNNGQIFVAYLFAHNAGGFGLNGTDNVISCGTYTADPTYGIATVNLGYEPQFIISKRTDSTSDWKMFDVMRGWNNTAASQLNPNLIAAESGSGSLPTATGFYDGGIWGAGAVIIYIAIRRGPMKVPTLGTSVFSTVARTGTGAAATITSPGFAPDVLLEMNRSNANGQSFWDKLRGRTLPLSTYSTAAENSGINVSPSPDDALLSFSNTGFSLGADSGSAVWNISGRTYATQCLVRAPGFFDEVCYTGDYAGNPQIPHNLTVAPELIIAKCRSGSGAWYINSPLIGTDFQLAFNTSAKTAGSTYTLTSTYFQNPSINYPTGGTFVAYLFATCPGVSKVGSYTGNGSTQTINCGFGAGGARFVLIKRTDSTGDWYVYDTARGMTTLTDPYLLLNSFATESATLGSVTTVATGFALNSSILAAINVSAGTYIFLAIA